MAREKEREGKEKGEKIREFERIKKIEFISRTIEVPLGKTLTYSKVLGHTRTHAAAKEF